MATVPNKDGGDTQVDEHIPSKLEEIIINTQPAG